MLHASDSKWQSWFLGIVLISHTKSPLPSARQHPSYGDCLEVQREYYQNSSVLTHSPYFASAQSNNSVSNKNSDNNDKDDVNSKIELNTFSVQKQIISDRSETV